MHPRLRHLFRRLRISRRRRLGFLDPATRGQQRDAQRQRGGHKRDDKDALNRDTQRMTECIIQASRGIATRQRIEQAIERNSGGINPRGG